MAKNIFYDNGAKGLLINDDGTGFAYYPNGGVAVCASSASSYQNSHYAFDKNKKMTNLLSLSELIIGFATSTKRKSSDVVEAINACFSEKGCLISIDGKIKHEWLWDRSALHCGNAPTDYLNILLNENLQLRLKDRTNAILEFRCEGLRHDFDLGLKTKPIDVLKTTLVARQLNFNESMRFQRNKLHPKSENLTELVRPVVRGLENRFDTLSSTMTSLPSLNSSWRDTALSSTLRELPKLALTGTESGTYTGYGKDIYLEREKLDNSNTLPTFLKDPKGFWRGSLEIRSTLREKNPPLKRSTMLRACSGRYSDMLVVDPRAVSADNPTGMATKPGRPLQRVHWTTFKDELNLSRSGGRSTAPSLEATGGGGTGGSSGTSGEGPVYVMLVVRGGDPLCCESEDVAAVLNDHLESERESSLGMTRPLTSSISGLDKTRAAGTRGHEALTRLRREAAVQGKITDIRMVRLDISEDPEAVADLDVKQVPVFCVFVRGELVYSGSLGGRKMRVSPSVRPQILLLDPNPHHQVVAEKCFRRLGGDVYLCMSAGEGFERAQQMMRRHAEARSVAVENTCHKPVPGTGGGSETLFHAVLISESLVREGATELSSLARVLSTGVSRGETVMCGLTSSHDWCKSIKWDTHCSPQVDDIFPPSFAGIVQYAVEMPLTSSSAEHILTLRTPALSEGTDGRSCGLTPERLLATILKLSQQSAISSTEPRGKVGIKLSSFDSSWKGFPLVS